MPNWCQNRLKITAPSEEALDKALSVLTNDEGHLDYNTLTPMPPEIDPDRLVATSQARWLKGLTTTSTTKAWRQTPIMAMTKRP